MARVLTEFENIQVVLNLVPSLLIQLEDYVQGRAKDRFLDLTRKPAADLTAFEREFILRNFFMVNWETNVRPLPRYWDLLHKRGRDIREIDLSRTGFSVNDMRDLQVLFNLAWMGFRAQEEEETIRALRTKGREFTENDKAALLDTQQRIVSRVIPSFMEAVQSGQAEIAVSPFYHCILPLVIDSESARRSIPSANLPPRFCWPEDARQHIRSALNYAEERFGIRPQGMWPSEGSVSPEALALMAEEGVKWCASDESILLRSRPLPLRSGQHYRPYRVVAGNGEMSMVFRDRGLSDLIGFSYCQSTAQDAVNDLFRHLNTIAYAAPKGETPVVTIALDGGKAWEHYPYSGRDFLRMLYRRLSEHEADIEAITPTVFLSEMVSDYIEHIHTGSWIDSDFHIWIGHPEDNCAWSCLQDLRKAIAEKEALIPFRPELADQVQAAKEAMYIAEGSDWFWWFGEDFANECIVEFDALFRAYVRTAWQALGEPVPFRLDEPIKRSGVAVTTPLHEPQGFITPRLDGKVRSYFDWLGAGLYCPQSAQGAMLREEGFFRYLYYGFDLQNLYLRLDPTTAWNSSDRISCELRLLLVAPEGRAEITIPGADGTHSPVLTTDNVSQLLIGEACFDEILEIALPFDKLKLVSGTRIAICVQLFQQGIETDRMPRHGFLSLTVPDEDFERKNWKV
jgi:alpha-amylase/alpha-mannosidase (GH57 family)